MLVNAERLRRFVTRIFTCAGAEDALAKETTDHLVLANLKGHDSHGVGMVPTYVGNIVRGNLQPNAHMAVRRDTGAVILADGCFGFGQVVGREATDLAISRSRETGLVCLGLRNAHHLGRIGTYGERCGEAGLVSVHFVNVVGHEPLVSPWGSRERRLQTNPFCAVVPRPDDAPIVLDMATSAIAFGKVRVAYMSGKPVPDGVLRDHAGEPTNDPKAMFEAPVGSLGPFGTYKGYGLALMCELLGGGLAGEWTMQPGNERIGTVVNNMLMFVLDPDALGGHDAFEREVLAMVDYVKGAAPAPGFDHVRIPGEPEREAAAERSVNGIPIDDNSWQALLEAARQAGMGEDEITVVAG